MHVSRFIGSCGLDPVIGSNKVYRVWSGFGRDYKRYGTVLQGVIEGSLPNVCTRGGGVEKGGLTRWVGAGLMQPMCKRTQEVGWGCMVERLYHGATCDRACCNTCPCT